MATPDFSLAETWWWGQVRLTAARRFLEQQSGELPFCESQQEQSRQPQQQHRFSGCLRLCVSTLSRQNWSMGIGRAHFESPDLLQRWGRPYPKIKPSRMVW